MSVLDKIKKAKAFLDKNGGKIESISSHGKNIFKKGKEILDSEDGKAMLAFAKRKFSKSASTNPPKESSKSEQNKMKAKGIPNFGFSNILNMTNKAKEIYNTDVKEALAAISEKENADASKNGNENKISSPKNENVNNEEKEAIEPQVITKEPKKSEEDTFFEDKSNELFNASKKALMNLNNPEEVLNAFCKLQSVANETIKYSEEQETKRVEINAKKDVAIEKIKTIERCIKEYLDKTFDERRSIFEKEFECIDKALNTGNIELLAISLNSINSLAAQSPFKALADIASVQKNLLDTSTEWDI